MPVTHRRRIVAVLLAVAVALALALAWIPEPEAPSAPAPTPAKAPAERAAALQDPPQKPPAVSAAAPPPTGLRLPEFVRDPSTGCTEVTVRIGQRDTKMLVNSEGLPCEGWGTLIIDVVDEQGLAAEHAFIVPVDCPALPLGMRPGEKNRVQVGPCTVRARRQDGALFTNSAPATVDVGPTDPAYLLLELPTARTGGIGVRFMPEESGMRVLEVVPDSPAADAGLAAGDLVLDVGGHATAGMEPGTFVELMTGAEGSDVTFTVGWTGDTGLVEETLTVARRFLDG